MMTRSRARRRRPESPEPTPTPEITTNTIPTVASTQTAWAGAAPAAPPLDDPSKKKTSTVSKKAKMARVDDWIRGDGEEKVKDDDVVAAEEEEDDDDEAVSSAPSSPLCEPCIPDKITNLGYYHETHMAYRKALEPIMAKYKEKIARQHKLPTLDLNKPGCGMRLGFGDRDAKHIPANGFEARKAVLYAARFVLGVSSSVGGEKLRRGSCFWIDRDEDGKTGTVLTTADLILRGFRYDIDGEEYVDDAEVIIHLRDNTTAKGHLLYYQKHYNLALFRVNLDQHVQLPSVSDKVQSDQQIFEIGRDEHFNLAMRYGRVEYTNPSFIDEYHCLSIVGGEVDFKYGSGGPVIDFDGNIVGMVNAHDTFVPSSILLKCLNLWRNFRCIPRPHLGFKFSAIMLLDITHIDKILGKCNIDKGLIVKEVSRGSHAEKLGVRVGDVIESFNGVHIRTIFELENILLSICNDHFDRGNYLNSKVDILMKVFQTRKRLRSIKTLTANLCEQKEVVKRACYPITIGEGFFDSVSLDHT